MALDRDDVALRLAEADVRESGLPVSDAYDDWAGDVMGATHALLAALAPKPAVASVEAPFLAPKGDAPDNAPVTYRFGDDVGVFRTGSSFKVAPLPVAAEAKRPTHVRIVKDACGCFTNGKVYPVAEWHGLPDVSPGTPYILDDHGVGKRVTLSTWEPCPPPAPVAPECPTCGSPSRKSDRTKCAKTGIHVGGGCDLCDDPFHVAPPTPAPPVDPVREAERAVGLPTHPAIDAGDAYRELVKASDRVKYTSFYCAGSDRVECHDSKALEALWVATDAVRAFARKCDGKGE